MQLRILAELCDTTTYILARQCCVNACNLLLPFRSLPFHFIFFTLPSTQRLNAANPRPGFPERGFCSLQKGSPFAQFTKMSAKDGWAMLLWAHSAFRTFGVSCESALPSTVAQLNGLCLLHALQHSANGCRAMQFRILTLQGRISPRISGTVDTQRLSGLRCLLRKYASVNGCPIEWLVSFARSPAFNQWLPYNAASHSDQAASCKRPCSGPVCRLHRLCSRNRFQPSPQTAF